MKSVLLTGASGFIGSNISIVLSNHFHVREVYRAEPDTTPLSEYVVCDFENHKNISTSVKNIDVVIHCAGLAHILKQNINNPINMFSKVNVDMTLRLANEAAKAGVKRFIFLSSIGVSGSSNKSAFTEQDIPKPTQDYALSKLEAEQGLQKIAASRDMEVVIIRPPLVYGPNAPGNFATLLRWMYKNIPLPLGAIHNKRSFAGIENLVDLIQTCIEHPAAANQVFLVSDGEDLSTTDLLKRVSRALGKKPRLLPVNQRFLEMSLRLLGKKDLAQRLCGSLQVDISKAKKLLNWTPPVSVDDGLRKTAEHFLKSHT